MAGKGILQIKVMGDSSHLEASLKKVVGAVAGLAVFKQVADYMVDAGKAAAKEDQQMQQLSKALKDNAGVTKEQYGEVEKWIAATQRATATADGELRPALLKLSSTTKDVGTAQDILSTALDISKARGLDLNTVVIAMEKGYQGNVGGLQRLGIATKDAEGNTLSFEQVMKNANETYGGAAQEAANTTAGRMQNLSLTLADLKETVGMALLPVIEKFTGFIMDNMPAIETIMVGFAQFVGAALNVLSEVVFPILQTVFEAFTGSVAGKIPGTNALFEGLGAVSKGLQSVFQAVWPAIQSVVKMFIDFFAGPTGQALIKGLMQAIGTALETLAGVFKSIWPVIQKIVQTFIDFWNSSTGQWLIKTLLDGIGAAIKALQIVWDGAWKALKPIVETAWKGIKPIIEAMISLIEKARDLYNWFTNADVKQQAAEHNSAALNRILSTGGNPANYGFYQKNGQWYSSYDQGGTVPGMAGAPQLAIVHGGETVASGSQTSAIERLIPVLARLASGGIGGGIVVNITGQGAAAGEAAADTFLQRVAAAGVRL